MDVAMAENHDGNPAELPNQQPTRHETALVLSTHNGLDRAKTILGFATADFARKREELEQSISKAKALDEALDKNATERQQLMAEVFELTDNNYNDIDHVDPKVAALQEKVAMLEAQVAQFQAKERQVATAHAPKGAFCIAVDDEDDMNDDDDDGNGDNDNNAAAVENQAKESQAAQQTLTFLLANPLRNGPVPDGALDLVRLMAGVKSPDRFHDINRCHLLSILPPLIPGVKGRQVVRQTEFETIMEVYAQLSGNLKQDDLSNLIVLISDLVSRQPSSEFYPITATLEHLWDRVNKIPVEAGALLALLQFVMLQLSGAVNKRFRPENPNVAVRMSPDPGCSPIIAKLAEAILSSKEGNTHLYLVDKLGQIARKRPKSGLRFTFHYEASASRGWFASNHEDILLLIKFEKYPGEVLAIHKSLCSLTPDWGVGRYILHINDRRAGWGEESTNSMLFESLPRNMCSWLLEWVDEENIEYQIPGW